MFTMSKRKVTKEELQQLEEFLIADYVDAKPLNLTQAHGFLSAVASAPSLIMPSKYQEILFGGQPEFASIKQVQAIINIIAMLLNEITLSFYLNKLGA